MEKNALLKDLGATLRGLDKPELDMLAEGVSLEVEARRPQLHIEDIRPGMSADERKAAEAEIRRLFSEGL